MREITDPLERRRWLEQHPNCNAYDGCGHEYEDKWTPYQLDKATEEFYVPEDEKESDLRELLDEVLDYRNENRLLECLLTAIVDRIEKLESSK